MTYGVCAPDLEFAERAIAAGFDYVEFGAGYVLENADRIKASGISTPRTNLFFPGDVRLFIDPTPYRDIARRRIAAASSIGVKVMVVGSGGARRVPDGEDGDARFADIVAELQLIADEYDIRLAPESLNHTETNVGVKLAVLAQLLLDRGLHFTADSYHILKEDEDFTQAIPVAPAHVHIANGPRLAPSPSDVELTPFVDRLRAVKYDGSISIEGTIENLVDANRNLRLLFNAAAI